MKTLLFFLIALVHLVAGQIQNPPSCGTDTMIGAISSSGCGFTDSNCVCKSQKFIDAANKIPKVCSNPVDQKIFMDFINGQCFGQPGYPLIPKTTATKGSKAQPSASGLPASRGTSLQSNVWGVVGMALFIAATI